MTPTVTRRARQTGVALAAMLVVVGCGNYSNEDLEYMNAVPDREDVAVVVPEHAALTTASAAEGWRLTWNVAQTFNGVADNLLTMLERIRSTYPTRREPMRRVWGPYPAERFPGWRVEFAVARAADDPNRFTYELVMIGAPTGPVPGRRVVIVAGDFAARSGIRRGEGRLNMTLTEARANGLVFPNLERLESLLLEYQTDAWPRRVHMELTNVPSVMPTGPERAEYTYVRQESGEGALTFSWVEDKVPGPAGPDTFLIEGRWRAGGEGRADVQVTAGDLAGIATSVECWGPLFMSTYKSATWAPPPVGDPSSCIPAS